MPTIIYRYTKHERVLIRCDKELATLNEEKFYYVTVSKNKEYSLYVWAESYFEAEATARLVTDGELFDPDAYLFDVICEAPQYNAEELDDWTNIDNYFYYDDSGEICDSLNTKWIFDKLDFYKDMASTDAFLALTNNKSEDLEKDITHRNYDEIVNVNMDVIDNIHKSILDVSKLKIDANNHLNHLINKRNEEKTELLYSFDDWFSVIAGKTLFEVKVESWETYSLNIKAEDKYEAAFMADSLDDYPWFKPSDYQKPVEVINGYRVSMAISKPQIAPEFTRVELGEWIDDSNNKVTRYKRLIAAEQAGVLYCCALEKKLRNILREKESKKRNDTKKKAVTVKIKKKQP